MRHCPLGGGILYYGWDAIQETVIDGKVVRPPKWSVAFGPDGVGLYRHRRRRKNEKRFLVVNYSHPWFALGASTSGGCGAIIKRADLAKRGGGQAGDTHRRYAGMFAQIGGHWVKAYLYIYPKGDGLR